MQAFELPPRVSLRNLKDISHEINPLWARDPKYEQQLKEYMKAQCMWISDDHVNSYEHMINEAIKANNRRAVEMLLDGHDGCDCNEFVDLMGPLKTAAQYGTIEMFLLVFYNYRYGEGRGRIWFNDLRPNADPKVTSFIEEVMRPFEAVDDVTGALKGFMWERSFYNLDAELAWWRDFTANKDGECYNDCLKMAEDDIAFAQVCEKWLSENGIFTAKL